MSKSPLTIPSQNPALTLARGSAPRYMQVAETLIQEIRDGQYPVGTLLPAEREISLRFGISRHTTREAVRLLEEQGLITRRAGIGTTIKSRLAQVRYTASVSDLTELISYAEKTRLQILNEEWVQIEGELAEVVPEAAGQRWLKITALRYPLDNDRPFAHTATLVPPRFEAIRLGLEGPQVSVFKLIEAILGEPVVELRQDITSRALPTKIAATLEMAPATPSLYIVRSYYDRRGDLVSVSLNYYPQDRVKLSTRWRLDTGTAV